METKRPTSLPRLNLPSVKDTKNPAKKGEIVTMSNQNKLLVEVDQQQLNESVSQHLELSPIDLKESNRDINRKLDALY